MEEFEWEVEEADNCGHLDCKEHVTLVLVGGKANLPIVSKNASYDLEESRKQFKLMSAAPNLLKALKQILADWESIPETLQVPDQINVNEHWDAVREAIAKA